VFFNKLKQHTEAKAGGQIHINKGPKPTHQHTKREDTNSWSLFLHQMNRVELHCRNEVKRNEEGKEMMEDGLQ